MPETETDDQLATFCQQVLVGEWTRLKGRAPQQGGWRPGKLLTIRLKSEIPRDKLEMFLRDAIRAWVLRFTVEGVTSTFFVDQHVLSAPHIKWMSEHRNEMDDLESRRLKEVPYHLQVFQGVLEGEGEFLDRCLSPQSPFLPAPNLWWVTACLLHVRWPEHGHLHRSLPKQAVYHEGKRYPLAEAVLNELRLLDRDRERRRAFDTSTFQAFKEAGFNWLERLGYGVSYQDEMDNRLCLRLTPQAVEAGLPGWCWLPKTEESLAERDKRFLIPVRKHRELPSPEEVVPRFINPPKEPKELAPQHRAFAAALSAAAVKQDEHEYD